MATLWNVRLDWQKGYPVKYNYSTWLVTMVRKLKYHEQKLLKKVDFISWKIDGNVREIQILKKYRITKREDYSKLATLFL